MNPTDADYFATVESPALNVPRIKTKRGTMALSSIRPGDWIGGPCNYPYFVVLINSKKLRRIVVRWEMTGHDEQSYDYGDFSSMDRLIGRGKPRRWHAFLPKWIGAMICPYSRP